MGTLELAVVGLAGSGIGTALGIPMVWPLGRRRLDVRLMGGWLLALSVLVALISARVIGLLPSTPAVNHAVNLVGLTAYPLLYFYVREQTGLAVGFRKASWAWIPAAIYAVALIVRSALGVSTRVPFQWMLPVVVAFTVICVVAVVRRSGHRPSGIVPSEAIVGFLLVLNVAQVIRMVFGHVALVPALVPMVTTAGFVAMVGWVVWRAVDTRPEAGPVVVGHSYAKSGLDQDAAMALLARIDQALSDRRLFADPALSLGSLAFALDSTPHRVSEVLNRYGGMTFHERLNRRRVADVKAQLLDPAADAYTIEGIGASAGFGSRSALYAAFRRIEGLAPTEFRAQRPPRVTLER